MSIFDKDYCYSYDDYWVINKNSVNFGRYNSYEDAKKVSDKLKECDWDKTKLRQIQLELNIVPRSRYSRGTSGYRRVYKYKNRQYEQGFTWVYQYKDKKTGKNIHISCVDLELLEKKVKAKGLRWEKY